MESKVKTNVKTDEKNNKKEEIKAENKKAEAKTEEKTDETSEEVNTDELFKHRESIALTPENAVFTRSAGGLISLSVTNAEGEKEFFERIVIRRSFPVSAPDEFLSVREPDTRAKGRGSEIGMIRHINLFDKATQDLINADLEVRYFTPEITKITSSREKFGYTYWDAETSAGTVSLVLNNPFSNIRTIDDGRIYIQDMDGNCFIITDPKKLDRQSLRYIEVYI
ncbi:MAG: DUF1854 domain-containing protein [Clostridia bacterium]|nr:DUF1854 domain-containing protein [Clostridia bacterium]